MIKLLLLIIVCYNCFLSRSFAEENTDTIEIVSGKSPDETTTRDNTKTSVEIVKPIENAANSDVTKDLDIKKELDAQELDITKELNTTKELDVKKELPKAKEVNKKNKDISIKIDDDIKNLDTNLSINDFSKKKDAKKKDKKTLAKDFESNPDNFTDSKKDLEVDGGYYVNKKQAVEDKKIPKYPDRGNNPGLVGDLMGILDNSDVKSKENVDSKESKKKKQEKIKMEKSIPYQITNEDIINQSIDPVDLTMPKDEDKKPSFWSKFLNAISEKTSNIVSSFASKEEVKIEKPKPKFNLADTFPDPTFYKIQKTDKFYKIPISILNDKTNAENLHIPSVDLSQDYKVLYLLFEKIKEDKQHQEIRAMLEHLKNKNLINKRDQYGNTLLNYAVRFNNLQSIHALIDYGANPNICNNSGICPIHLAIFNRQDYIFDLLAKAHIKYDLKDIYGFDPLIYSIYSGNYYAFIKLLQVSPYLDLRKQDFEYLLSLAKDGENYEIYEYINEIIAQKK